MNRILAYLRAGNPLPLLAASCAVQVAIGAAIALTSTHNHFVWYSGGDATEYWTDGWALAHHLIPQAHVGYGVPLLYAWTPLVTGATLIAALPVLTLLQLVVFVPLAAILVWAIGDLLFGRLFAWWALLLWIAAPLLLLWGFHGDYAPEFKSLFLAPHWYGLTVMADFPSLVAVLATTWAMLRMSQRRSVEDAVLSGLFMGALIAFKPANGFFVPAALVLLLATRNVRAIAAWAIGLAPSLIALTIWKARGLGSVPILAVRSAREAIGDHAVLAVSNPYVHFDLSHLEGEMRDLGNVFWSLRLLEFLAVAGFLGALRRSPLKAIFLALWFGAFCIVKGSSGLASINSISYYRYVEPGFPAYALLAASIVFLIPRMGRPYLPVHDSGPIVGGRRTLGAAFALLGVVPVVVLAVTPAAASVRYVWDPTRGNDAPISTQLAATAIRSGEATRLTWPAYKTGALVYYTVYRAATAQTCTVPTVGGKECDLQMKTVGYTRVPSFTDHPPPGPHWYRIGLMANYSDALDGSDLMLIGPATAATTAR